MRALDLAERHFGLHPPYHLAVIGLVALWRGDASTGAEWLGRAHSSALELGWYEPANRPWTDDYVEALLELGRIDAAVEVLDRWEADARRLARKRILARALRCRGQIAAARGQIDEAMALLEEAAVQHGEPGDPYGRARALLALGVVRRRARQKRPAREAIADALAGFEQLGAATWIERARTELGSIGGRTREEGLTPAEQRVAALVAEGRTNREVAAALFLGERTVASHLTKIYAKLGYPLSNGAGPRVARIAEQSSDVLTFSRRTGRHSVERMPSYLVETYLARGHSEELAGRDRRARSAAEELTRRQLRPLDSRSRGRALLLRLRCTVEPGRAPCGRARRARSDPRRRSDLVLASKGGHMKSKWMFALLGVLAVVGVFAGTVLATPPSGQTTTTLARAPLEPMNLKVKSDPPNLWRLKLKTHGVSDGYVVSNTFAANGGTSGWHSHPGPSVIFVTAGTITSHMSDGHHCMQQDYTAGQGIRRPGRRRQHAHDREQRQHRGEDGRRATRAGRSGETHRRRRPLQLSSIGESLAHAGLSSLPPPS